MGQEGGANLGHAHPAVLEAIQAQAGQLISCPEIFYNDRRAELLAALAEVAPPASIGPFCAIRAPKRWKQRSSSPA